MSSAIPPTSNLTEAENTTEQLTCIWENLLGVHPIEPDQNYFDLGGDSILAVQMFAQIDQMFQVKLPVATLFEAPTIGDLAQIVNLAGPKSRWSSLVTIQPKGFRPPFFCVHAHGGNVLGYRQLSRHLGDDQPFYGLQSQGLDGTCPPLTRVEEMASFYLLEVQSLQPHGPYFLGGYCMGGLIAYEMAQQLLKRGERVELLVLIDTLSWAGTLPPSLWERSHHAIERAIFHLDNFISIKGKTRIKFLREKKKSLEIRLRIWWRSVLGTPSKIPDFEKSESVILGRILQANSQACLDYTPSPYLGSLTELRPIKQYKSYTKAELNWDLLARGNHNVLMLPVNAPAVTAEVFVHHLARALRELLEDAYSRLPPAPKRT